MPAARYFSPVNTLEQKLQIQRRLGGVKSCKYFSLLTSFLSDKISKPDFDRICIQTIGRENIPLHNHFLKSILKKASLPNTTLQRQSGVQATLNVQTPNGRNGLPPLSKNFPKSPRKCRTPNLRDRRYKDRPSPLGPHGKNSSTEFENSTPKIQVQQRDSTPLEEQQHDSTPILQEPQHDSTPKIQEQQHDSTPEIQEQQRHTDSQCAVNMLPVPMEYREEVDRDPKSLAINRSPIRAHLPQDRQQCHTDSQCAVNRLSVSTEYGDEVDRGPESLAIHKSPIQAPLSQDRQQRHTDPHCAVNMLPMSVAYGEEFDRDSESMAVSRMSPIQAPLALPTYDNRAQRLTHKGSLSGIVTDTCQSIGHLPDTHSLMKWLEHNMETEGCKVSADAANVLNNALNVYLKRLIKPCLDLAASKSVKKVSGQIQPGLSELPQSRSASVSISDFKTAMELNPTILGEDWSLHFERICFLASEE